MRKYIMYVFYFLSVLILGYLVLASLSSSNNNRIIIGTSQEIAGREISFQGYWQDERIIGEMVKTGAIDKSLVDHSKTIWIANMKVTAKQGPIKVGIDDFKLEDNEGKVYKPIIEPHPVKELTKGEDLNCQLVYYIPSKNTVSTITYAVKGETFKKLIFHVGE